MGGGWTAFSFPSREMQGWACVVAAAAGGYDTRRRSLVCNDLMTIMTFLTNLCVVGPDWLGWGEKGWDYLGPLLQLCRRPCWLYAPA